mgnify:CR=1 FL=1
MRGLTYFTYRSPLGPLLIVMRKGRVAISEFTSKGGEVLKEVRREVGEDIEEGSPEWLKEALDKYFSGSKVDLESFPVEPLSGTEFEREVWREVRRVPYGKVVTYSEVAKRIGKPEAWRAVGRALAKNRILLFIPCHRVVSTRGLGGFSSGVDLKVELLKLEGLDPRSLEVGRVER